MKETMRDRFQNTTIHEISQVLRRLTLSSLSVFLLLAGCASEPVKVDPLEVLKREIRTALEQTADEGPTPNQQYLFVNKKFPVFASQEEAKERNPSAAVAYLPRGFYRIPPAVKHKGVLGDPFPSGCFFHIQQGDNSPKEPNVAIFFFPKMTGVTEKYWQIKSLKHVIFPVVFSISERTSVLSFVALRNTGGLFSFVALSKPVEIAGERLMIKARTTYNTKSNLALAANIYQPAENGPTLTGKVEFQWDGKKFSNLTARQIKKNIKLEYYQISDGTSKK